MPGETKQEMLEIDLTCISPDDTFRLSQFFKESLDEGTKKWGTAKGLPEVKSEAYSFWDGTPFKFKQEVIAYLNQPGETHFLICPDLSNPLGTGHWSKVFSVDSFSFDQHGKSCLKTNQYVAKVQQFNIVEGTIPSGFIHNDYCTLPLATEIPETDLKSLQKELSYARKTQHLQIKEPTLLPLSDENIISFTVMAKLPGRELLDIFIKENQSEINYLTSKRLDLFKQLLKIIPLQTEALGIVHKDIKPENIIVMEPWIVNLCDYDCALNIQDPEPDNRGTVDYQAPELQVEEEKPTSSQITSKLDVFSLGVVLARLFWIPLESDKYHPVVVGNDDKTRRNIQSGLDLFWNKAQRMKGSDPQLKHLLDNPENKNILLEILSGMVKLNPSERLSFEAVNALAAKIPSLPSEPPLIPTIEDRTVAPSAASKIDYFFKGPSAKAHETIKLTFEALEKKIDKLSIDKYIKFFESHEQSGDLKKAAQSYLLSYIELLEKIGHLNQVKNPSGIPLLLENFVNGTSPDFLKTMSETINPRIKNHPLILASQELKDILVANAELMFAEKPMKMHFAG